MGTIHFMNEPSEQPAEDEAPAERRKTVPVDPAKAVGQAKIVPRMGVRSPDYGTGTVVTITGNGVLIYWDEALTGTTTHVLEHQRSFVERLERLDD